MLAPALTYLPKGSVELTLGYQDFLGRDRSQCRSAHDLHNLLADFLLGWGLFSHRRCSMGVPNVGRMYRTPASMVVVPVSWIRKRAICLTASFNVVLNLWTGGVSEAEPAAEPNRAVVIRVATGESIAQAIEGASPGSVIEVEPGTYREALLADIPDLTLRGIVRGDSRPVLEGDGELSDGVIATRAAFTMSGFAIRHYRGNGVSTQGVAGVLLSDLRIEDSGLYGLYPVESWNVEIRDCVVSGARDAGIYVGTSNRVRVVHNEVHHNVIGIQIQNTNDAEIRDNNAHDNSAGIVVDLVPHRIQKAAARTQVLGNRVAENNLTNFGDPVARAAKLPPGLGILVRGADATRIEGNQVVDNRSLGIGVIRLAKGEAEEDPDIDPLPDDTRIGPNTHHGNGLDPHRTTLERIGGMGEIVWDGTGARNCSMLEAPSSPVELHRCDLASTRPSAAASNSIARTSADLMP